MILSILTLAVNIVHSQSTNCYQRSALFGTTLLASMVDDVALLRSSTFKTDMIVSAINVCGTFGAFDGIQIFLKNS